MKKVISLFGLLLISLTVIGMATQAEKAAIGYQLKLFKNGKVPGVMPLSTEQRDLFTTWQKQKSYGFVNANEIKQKFDLSIHDNLKDLDFDNLQIITPCSSQSAISIANWTSRSFTVDVKHIASLS